MFTGIIKARAQVKKAENRDGSLFLTIATPKSWRIKPGDSVATDGVCLTVKKVGRGAYLTELMPETLSKTSFGERVPTKVNLEPSLKFSDLLGGHLVLGHVDAAGKIESIKVQGASKVYKVSFPKQFDKFVADKGNVAVDGVSLTIVKAKKNWFTVSLVDYTLKHTVLGIKQTGQIVNLEFDLIAKYLSRLINR